MDPMHPPVLLVSICIVALRPCGEDLVCMREVKEARQRLCSKHAFQIAALALRAYPVCS